MPALYVMGFLRIPVFRGVLSSFGLEPVAWSRFDSSRALAKDTIFASVENEMGTVQVIVSPHLRETQRDLLLRATLWLCCFIALSSQGFTSMPSMPRGGLCRPCLRPSSLFLLLDNRNFSPNYLCTDFLRASFNSYTASSSFVHWFNASFMASHSNSFPLALSSTSLIIIFETL